LKGFRTLPGRILVGLVSAAVLIPLFLNACSSSSLPSNRTLTTIPSITAPAISSGAVPAVSPVKTTPVSASSQDKSVHVWASPERQEIHTGEKFAVNIWIKTSIAVRGVQWRLTFDPQKLRCDSAQEGDFLKNWAVQHEGSTLVFPQPETDNAS
jgi:hypothetical protein